MRQWRVVVRRDQAVLRSVVLLGPVVLLVAAALAGAPLTWWPVAGVVLLAVVTALRPDSPVGLLLLAASGAFWGLRVDESLSAWVLLGSAGLVATHCAALLAAQGPETMPVDRVQARLWSLRGSATWLASVGVWGMVLLLRSAPVSQTVFAAGLALLAVVAAVVTMRLSTSRDPA